MARRNLAAAAVLLLALVCGASAQRAATTATPAPLTTRVNEGSALKALLDNEYDLKLFARVANASGLTPALNATVTKVTIFAPTDRAIEKLAAEMGVTPEELLKNQMLVDRLAGYHIHTGGAVKSSDLKTGTAIKVARGGDLVAEVIPAQPSSTSRADRSERLALKGAQNTAKVVSADVPAGKSVIHAIDTVLLPGDVFPTLKAALTFKRSTEPVAKLILADPSLSKAAADPKTAVTLFAPVKDAADAAFATPAGRALASNKTAVAALLSYHVVPGGARILPNGVKDGQALQTALKGHALTVKKTVAKGPDGASVGTLSLVPDKPGAKPVKVGKFNIIAGSSMVHIVDGVLTPKAL